MNYFETLDKLRREVFSEPSPQPKEKSTGFIPLRQSAPEGDSRDLAGRARDWLQQIKAASEEAKGKTSGGGASGSFASGLAKTLSAKIEEDTYEKNVKDENKEAFIKRRGDTPSMYAPDKPYHPAQRRVEFEGDWENVAQAVKDIESGGGDYSARGPEVKKGMYKGERAMGAYQIMPGNLPQWSKAALGREVTEEEFMADPAIQDAIFIDQMNKAKDKYGSVEDAVSVWFSGRPLSTAGSSSDGYLTVPEYVGKFQNRYNMYRSNAR